MPIAKAATNINAAVGLAGLKPGNREFEIGRIVIKPVRFSVQIISGSALKAI
jgi:hypothetical protein